MIKALFGTEAASIGIIGGADGPTAIFVSGGSSWLVPALCLAALLAILVILLVKRK